mmetsp:Transcript_6393/g.4822  ORF Transcript_6393/g.4822 Transcript_6393/m.4822 type:complete len:109 (-) Transcript_6393:97-423(-)
MDSKAPAISLRDLESGAKNLHSVGNPAPSRDDKKAGESDEQALQMLEDLYNRFDGDLDRIFQELNADPSKAKKPHHRPRDARNFAVNYVAGYYSVIDSEADADSKSHK